MVGQKIKISGVAIREGVSRNKVKYRADELKKFAPTLVGRPILKDHKSETDNVIGLVERADVLDGGKIVTYEGWIKDDGTGLAEKIADGRIKEVSISGVAGKVVKESEDADYIVVKDVEALELSTTPTPGVKGTSLSMESNRLDLTEEGVKRMIESYEKEQEKMITCPGCGAKFEMKEKMAKCPTCGKKWNYEESTSDSRLSDKQIKGGYMESENVQKNEAQFSEVQAKFEKQLAEMKAKLEVSEKAAKDLEEARRLDAIARYNEKAAAKKVKAKNLSNATMETIVALTEMVEDLEAPTEDAVEEAEEEVAEEKVKAKAVTKTKEVSSETSNQFSEYVMDSSESKIAFYKWY